MTVSLRKVVTSLIFVFTTVLFVLFILFDTYTWGKFVLLLLTVCILLLGSTLNKGKIAFAFGPYVTLNLLFTCFVFFSSIWAKSFSDSITIARTLFRIFVCAYALFITVLNVPELDETKLLKAVMWAGYIVSIYTLTFYGLDEMIAAGAESSLRVENEFSNVNTIGLACALSCVIQVNLRNLRPKDHFFPFAFLMIPCVVVIAATQSRKALVFLVAGVLGYAIVKAQKSEKTLVIKVAKILLGFLIFALLLYLLLQLDIFSGVRERMESMLNAVSGEGDVDGSTQMRNQLKTLGLKWFFKYPIGGVGIGSPHLLAAQYIGFDSYLHDNFVELLCGGGIIGFGLYYS